MRALEHPEEAVEAARKAVRMRPTVARFHGELGLVLRQVERMEESLRHYEMRVQLAPWNADYHGGLAMARYRVWDIDGAIQAMRESLRLNPASADSYNLLGYYLRKRGSQSEAIAAFRRSREIDPSKDVPLLNLLQTLREVGDDADMDREMERALRRGGFEGWIRESIGSSLILRGDFEEGLEHLRAAMQLLSPDDAFVHNAAGETLRGLGRLQESREVLEEAVLRPKNQAYAYRQLGTTLLALGGEEEGLEALRQGILLEPEDAVGQANLYLALYRAGRIREAVEQWHEALAVIDARLERNPFHVEANLNRGGLLLVPPKPGLGDALQGLLQLERLLEYSRTMTTTWQLLARAHLENGDPESALEDLKEHDRLHGSDPEVAAFLRAWALFELGREQEAEAEWDRALELHRRRSPHELIAQETRDRVESVMGGGR
jgi:tetratricopeptide (TPR) repeat protein